MTYCHCGMSGSVWCAGANCYAHDVEEHDPDVCVHGKGFSEFCVECCPEDDDGSFTGDEWTEA